MKLARQRRGPSSRRSGMRCRRGSWRTRRLSEFSLFKVGQVQKAAADNDLVGLVNRYQPKMPFASDTCCGGPEVHTTATAIRTLVPSRAVRKLPDPPGRDLRRGRAHAADGQAQPLSRPIGRGRERRAGRSSDRGRKPARGHHRRRCTEGLVGRQHRRDRDSQAHHEGRHGVQEPAIENATRDRRQYGAVTRLARDQVGFSSISDVGLCGMLGGSRRMSVTIYERRLVAGSRRSGD